MTRRLASVALLMASVAAGCKGHKYDPNAYVLNPSSLDHVLVISADRPRMPADGFSRTMIRAKIPADADTVSRTVKFTTTAGLLVGDKSDKDVDVAVDSTGAAAIALESEKALRTAIIRAKVGEFVRETTVEFVAVVPADVITVAASRLNLPADGRSAARIVASVASGLPTDRKKVQFVTTLGEFSESEAKTYNPTSTLNDQAGADLRSSERGRARVTAQVDGVAAEVEVQFDVANPEQIVVTSHRFSVPANTTQGQVTARLLRAIGTPTEGFIVTWSALNPSGTKVGHFSNPEPSKPDGTAIAQYSAENEIYRGPVRITASVAGVSGSVDVEIVDP